MLDKIDYLVHIQFSLTHWMALFIPGIEPHISIYDLDGIKCSRLEQLYFNAVKKISVTTTIMRYDNDIVPLSKVVQPVQLNKQARDILKQYPHCYPFTITVMGHFIIRNFAGRINGELIDTTIDSWQDIFENWFISSYHNTTHNSENC